MGFIGSTCTALPLVCMISHELRGPPLQAVRLGVVTKILVVAAQVEFESRSWSSNSQFSFKR
jgi:hypothetical protein